MRGDQRLELQPSLEQGQAPDRRAESLVVPGARVAAAAVHDPCATVGERDEDALALPDVEHPDLQMRRVKRRLPGGGGGGLLKTSRCDLVEHDTASRTDRRPGCSPGKYPPAVRRASRSSALLSLLLALALWVVPIARAPEAAAASCGVWRWDVKTLSDPDRRDVDFTAQATRIDHLRKLDPPSSLSSDTPRLDGIEKQVFSVRAQVITATVEDDSDIHLVIATRGERRHTMIVEFPLAFCVAKRFKRTQMTRSGERGEAPRAPIAER